MLADRLLRWYSIHPTLVYCLLFRQLHPVTGIGGSGIASGGPALHILGQNLYNIGSMLRAGCASKALDWNNVGPALM